MTPLKVLRALIALLAGSLLLTACDFDVYKLPLPGGTDVGDDAITVTAEFHDVLDLVPKSTVKVNDVNVGQVTDISLDGQDHARVTMELRKDVHLPANAIAEIRQTSLLGEKFVSLGPPESGPTGELADGADIPIDRTGRNPEVEEVLGALSLLLNGGGVAQLKTIADELNQALEGREGAARSVLEQVRTLMTQLDDNKRHIVNAIDSLNNLAISVRKQQGSIDQALDQLPSALTSLDQQRADLVKMLHSLDRLGGVGVRVIKASKDATIGAVRQLNPVLTELADSGDAFVKSFNVFLTYPFVDEVVGRDPQVARNLHMGDYTNLSIELDLDFSQLGGPEVPGLPAATCIPFEELSDITQLPALRKLCDHARQQVTRCLNDLKDGDVDIARCERLVHDAIGDTVDTICQTPLGSLPGLCPPGSGGNGGAGGGGGGPGGPLDGLGNGLGNGLGDGLGGLGRPGAGPTRSAGDRGPTMRQLTQIFDPGLVQLLVPGMVMTR